jgi:hypothetical protein
VGNIFYSYKEIDPNGELFKSWVELTSPIFELFGTEPTDIISHKRWLAILGGGLLPVISLTSLHFFVKYEEPEKHNIENDRDLEIVSLMDLETTLEKEEQEEKKPKVKRGRKKKEVVEEQPKVEEVIVEEPQQDEIPQIEETPIVEIKSEEIITETTTEPMVITKRPTKLTYTKPNVSIDRL